MTKQKTHRDVRGWKINCLNYTMCPLCYGCRNYTSGHLKCETCKDTNEKLNLCDTGRHKADLVAKMVKREQIIVKKEVN